MRTTPFRLLLALGCSLSLGCATKSYVYSFDLTDPGARNLSKSGERDTLEDADVKTEILVDPTSFQAIALDITNKTDALLVVGWNNILIIGPDHSEAPIRPDTNLGAIQPGAKVVSRLAPFVLPSSGSAAEQYDNSSFEIVVPMVVRNVPREYRYHLKAKLQQL